MPIRLAILGSSPCDRCTAQCCRQTVSKYAILLQSDEERSRFAPWSQLLVVKDDRGTTRTERVVTYRDQKCPFLGDDNRCTIYESRPQACRDFECIRHFNQNGIAAHGYFLDRNTTVRTMLENL